MTVTPSPWTSSSPNAVGRILIQLPLPVLDSLGNSDLQTARSLSNLPLTPYIATECARVWKLRAVQIRGDPEDAAWVTRLLITSDGTVVGRAGFHGRPDATGMVEVGYSIDPQHRRQGHARAALAIMIEMARNDPSVRTLRATVAPDNVASRTLIESFGLKEVGEQWDEEDGLEIIFEVGCDMAPEEGRLI
ncbi:acetyltransferase gnat family protein [Metarhizium brunneum]